MSICYVMHKPSADTDTNSEFLYFSLELYNTSVDTDKGTNKDNGTGR